MPDPAANVTVPAKPTPRPLGEGVDAHPLADLLPRMSGAEIEALVASIAEQGQIEPVVIYEDKILDGRHRYGVCLSLGIDPLGVEFGDMGLDLGPAEFVAAKAQHRHLNVSQKAMAAARLLPSLQAEAAARARRGLAADGPAGRASKFAGSLFGVGQRYVEAAKQIIAADPAESDAVFEGRSSLSQARSRLARRARAARQAAALADLPPLDEAAGRVIVGDAVRSLASEVDYDSVDLVFTDPPYNIGVDYGFGGGPADDRLDDHDFLYGLRDAFAECYRVLRPGGSIFVVMSSRYGADLKSCLGDHLFDIRAMIVWEEAFAQHQEGNFADDFRVVWYGVKPGAPFTWEPDRVRVPSARQAEYGDARADPDGRVPGRVWRFPRVAGTFGDRVPGGNANQLPPALVERCLLVASHPGDLVLDPFSGGATTGAVALRHGRRYLGVERVPATAERSRDRLRQALHDARQTQQPAQQTKEAPDAA